MFGHHLWVALVFPAAHLLVDAVAVERLTRMLREDGRDVELAPRQVTERRA